MAKQIWNMQGKIIKSERHLLYFFLTTYMCQIIF